MSYNHFATGADFKIPVQVQAKQQSGLNSMVCIAEILSQRLPKYL